jgi:hypothetical protein
MIKNSTSFKIISLFFLSAFILIVYQLYSDTYGGPSGYSGAPGDSNCTSCHSGTPISNSSAIKVFTNMTNGQYIPDSTYQIIVRAKKSGCVKFGFETTMLNANSSPTKLGTLLLPTGATRIQKNSGTRDYITHTTAGTSAIYTDSTDWTFNWKAPSTLSGDAKLYVAMNATNNNSNYTGDEINLQNFTFPQTTNAPVASITVNTNSVCQNDSIYFEGSATNGGSSYSWTFPGGTPASSTLQNQWVKFTTSGNKVCSLRVANSITYSNYTTKTVTINSTPNSSISYGNQVLCTGDSIALSVSSVSGYTYQWQKDGADINGQTNPVFYAKVSGSYQVKIVNSSGGCTQTTSAVSLSFNAKPQASLSAPNGDKTCQGDSIKLLANSDPSYNYYWYKDNVLISQTTDSVYYARQTGNYYVKTYNPALCNMQSNTIPVWFYIKPSAIVTASKDSVCQGDSILLTSVTADTIASYQWKVNNADITGANNKTYYALSGGSYNVELITNHGCKNITASKTTKVNPYPNANFIDSIKVGCIYTLKIRNTGNFNFQWQRNGTTFNTTDTIVTASLSGTYSLKIINSSGCSINTNSIVLNIPNAPNVNITPVSNAVICSDSSGVTYQVPFAAATTYSWYKNGSPITGANQNSLNIIDSGNYYVVVNNGLCIVQSSTRNVKVNAVPVTNFIDSVKTGCAYNLKLRTIGNFNLQWFRNGNLINSTDTMITATLSGTYLLKITNASGCNVLTNSIALSFPTSLPDANIFPTNDAVICSDSSGVTYHVPPASGAVFRWYKNGNLITGANQNSLTIIDSGDYYVSVDNGFCIVPSAMRKVKVNPTPAVSLLGNNDFCTGDSSILTTNNITGAIYQWTKDNLQISGATNNSLVVKSTGVYNVRVSLGTCSKKSNSVIVTEKSLPAIPLISRNVNLLTSTFENSYQWYKDGILLPGETQQTYTVTADGNYAVEVKAANGCKNISAETSILYNGINLSGSVNIITAFPNPVNNELNLHFSESNLYQIEVLDASGRILKSGNIDGSKYIMDFSDFESGIYFIKVSTGGANKIIRIMKN